MRDDDELCLCFHVTRRKAQNYIRIHQPRVASQLSECGGAGTGCGWCRPMLRRLLEQARANRSSGGGSAGDAAAGDAAAGLNDPWPDPEQYAAGRQQHLKNR